MSWENVNIVDIVKIINEPVKQFDGQKPYLATGDLSEEVKGDLESVSYDVRPSRANLTAQPGDVILARMQATNKVLEVTDKESDMIFSTGFLVLRSSEKLCNRYLYHFLASDNFQIKKDKLCSGATQKAINNENFKNLQIPLPPLITQKHIAEILDKADALRRKDQELLEKYDELVLSRFLFMINEEEIRQVKLEDLVEQGKNKIRTGPFGSDLLHSEFIDEGISVLGIDNVVQNKFAWKGRRFISPEKYRLLSRYKVFPQDILISIMGTLGKSAVVPDNIGEAINTKHLVAITVDTSKVIPTFLSYSIQFNPSILSQILSKTRGAIMGGLNMGLIKDLIVDIPSIEKQVAFSDFSSLVEKQKSIVVKANVEALFQSLLQQAFNGELTN